MKPETFIEYFRTRHGWSCKPGSRIFKDLTAFANEQVGSPDSPDELYQIFCTLHGIRPKPAAQDYVHAEGTTGKVLGDRMRP